MKHYMSQILKSILKLNSLYLPFINYNQSTIYLYDGINSDSKLRPKLPTFTFLNKYPINKEDLYEILDEARVIKSQEEIKIMKFVCMLASEAHEKVL